MKSVVREFETFSTRVLALSLAFVLSCSGAPSERVSVPHVATKASVAASAAAPTAIAVTKTNPAPVRRDEPPEKPWWLDIATVDGPLWSSRFNVGSLVRRGPDAVMVDGGLVHMALPTGTTTSPQPTKGTLQGGVLVERLPKNMSLRVSDPFGQFAPWEMPLRQSNGVPLYDKLVDGGPLLLATDCAGIQANTRGSPTNAIRAFVREDGRALWSRTIGTCYQPPAAMNDADRVFVLSVAEGTAALDTLDKYTGDLIWRVPLATNQPILRLAGTGLLVAGPVGPGSATQLLLLDAATGATRWKTETPRIVNAAADEQQVYALVLGAGNTTLVAWRAVDGKEVWRHDVGRVAGQPGLHAASGRVAMMLGSTLIVFDAETGAERWRWSVADKQPSAVSAMQPIVGTPLVLVSNGRTTLAFHLGRDLSQRSARVRGRIRVTSKVPLAGQVDLSTLDVLANGVIIHPDKQGRFELSLRGRGQVQLEVSTSKFFELAKPAVGGDFCTGAKPPLDPMDLEVTSPRKPVDIHIVANRCTLL